MAAVPEGNGRLVSLAASRRKSLEAESEEKRSDAADDRPVVGDHGTGVTCGLRKGAREEDGSRDEAEN